MNKWYNKLQYGAMLLMAAAMPISWRFGLYVALLLAVVSVVKMVAERGFWNSALDWRLRIPFYAILLYWLMIVVSVFFSTDTAVAWQVVGRKAGLIIFPLCFLLTDTSYLNAKCLRGLGYALLVSVCGVFLYFVGNAVVKMMNGDTLAYVFGESVFDPRHHAYTSMYADVAIAFVYFELSGHWDDLKGWLRGLLIASLPVCMLYVEIVNSRAGLLVLYILAVVCLLHLAIVRRRWVAAVIAAVLVTGFLLLVPRMLANHGNRLDATISDVTSDEPKDARVKIYRSVVKSAKESPLVGYGAGDYRQTLEEQYKADGNNYSYEHQQNAHNQYLETILTLGVVGLVPLLLFLLWPLGFAWCRKSPALFLTAVMVGIVMFNLLVESMLERQMGLLFIGYLLSVIVLILSLEENKFGRVRKS